MVAIDSIVFVFLAGLVTAIATGIGALPFFLVDELNLRWEVGLWGLASGIMVSASVFGLLREGLREAGSGFLLGSGILTGVFLVLAAEKIVHSHEVDPREFEQADFNKLLIILGILTVHSFPEGVAVGVSFAEMGLTGGLPLFGLAVPVLGVVMTVAIAIHNIPEGTAISIPLRSMGVSKWRMVGWSIFSSLPQPVGAVIAFVFVRAAKQLLPFGYGFGAGAMIFLVLYEFLPEGLEHGEELPGGGKKELAAGFLFGALLMVPLVLLEPV
ncbi:MAG: ZIP family metal transporter [Candidatus Nanohaloarchaea archaeon]|nr:ZIP family metal transporter [Candidatus Nanohaloarchaea archaeon]